MKRIVKGAAPQMFADWLAMSNDDWQPTWDNFGGHVEGLGHPKKAVHEALLAEQGKLCCYCECRIGEHDDDSDIEHLVPRRLCHAKSLDYANMACSCKVQGSCGVEKRDWHEPARFVSPLDGDCEQRFKHSSDGKIKARLAGDDAAETTIEKLGLNIPRLVAERGQTLRQFLAGFQKSADKRAYVSAYLLKKNGRYAPFWTMINERYGRYSKGIAHAV